MPTSFKMSKKMYIIAFLLLLISVFITYKNLKAQAHVDNKGYDLMLSALLKHDVKELSIDSFKQDTNLVVLDARAYEEFQVSHIKNAVWVGYDDFNLSRLDSISKNENIVVYCSVGYRSEKITEQLISAGFLNASNLYGGIFEWVNKDNPVVDMQDQPTNKVHPYSSTWGVWLTKGEKAYK